MAVAAVKQDSNIVGLSYAEETAVLGVLPVTPVWYQLEPNSIGNFGGALKTVARDPINPSRQRKKGTVTDLDATVAFVTDLTQTNQQDLLQGFFFADLRRKAEFGVLTGNFTTVETADDSYNAASGLSVFLANDLVFASTFVNGGNNGLHRVLTTAAGKITVAENLVDESPAAGIGALVAVGHEFVVATVDVVAPGAAYPKLSRASGALDYTTLGLLPGEIIFIGGDASDERFVGTNNNGFARVRSVAASYIELDKTSEVMTSETGTGLTIRIFYGRVLKNELGDLITRRSYNLEELLGAEDLDEPTQIQSNYVTGCVGNKWKLNIPTGDKIVTDLEYIGTNFETRAGAVGKKSGTRSTLVETDCFNTSSDVTRIKLASVTANDSCPASLFSYLETLSIELNNNIKPDKAVGVLGAFDVTTGTFQVEGSADAYFASVAAIELVRDNVDATLEIHLVKLNTGISFDLPLLSIGDAQPKVEKDTAIKQPITVQAATGVKIASWLDYTMLMVFWDYLPSLADS